MQSIQDLIDKEYIKIENQEQISDSTASVNNNISNTIPKTEQQEEVMNNTSANEVIELLQKSLDILTQTKGYDAEPSYTAEHMEEYKKDFYEMSVGSIRAIASHAQNILTNLENPLVAENLTESWLQGKIAITEDYMRTIHDFVMYVQDSDDTSDAGSRPGLWENIRKKKERMGKKYKPAKPGDKDRPDSEQWKKLTK